MMNKITLEDQLNTKEWFHKHKNNIITWNAEKFGVEIKTNTEHFVISAMPSMVMSWNDAVRFYNDNNEWRLPKQEHLKLIAKHLVKINTLIQDNRGYEIQGWHWSSDDYDEICAWYVEMYDGNSYSDTKDEYSYVRAVAALNN